MPCRSWFRLETASFPSGNSSPDSQRPTPDSNQPNAPADQKLSLSDQVIQDVLEPLRSGIVGQDLNQVMSVFDKQPYRATANLQQQLRAFFELYSEVDFRYQILQVTADKDHGSATAEIEMDALPYEVTPDAGAAQRPDALSAEAHGQGLEGGGVYSCRLLQPGIQPG